MRYNIKQIHQIVDVWRERSVDKVENIIIIGQNVS